MNSYFKPQKWTLGNTCGLKFLEENHEPNKINKDIKLTKSRESESYDASGDALWLFLVIRHHCMSNLRLKTALTFAFEISACQNGWS